MDTTVSCTIGVVRFSYANVWKPRKNDDGSEKYGLAVLIKKTDKKTISQVKKAVQAAATNKKGLEKLKGKKNWRNPLRDGDEEKAGDGAYEGHYFFNCNSDRQPGIVDKDREEIIDQRLFYSGCFGYVSVNFAAYNEKGNAGVGVYLNHVMKTKDGPPLTGGGGSAEDAFADIEIDEDDEDDDLGSEFY